MPPLVFDFKDIASRMKGELKAQPEPVETLSKKLRDWRDMTPQPAICFKCLGIGIDARGNYCYLCMGSGVMP